MDEPKEGWIKPVEAVVKELKIVVEASERMLDEKASLAMPDDVERMLRQIRKNADRLVGELQQFHQELGYLPQDHEIFRVHIEDETDIHSNPTE